jgi:cytochrome c-type biogenesis protein CcmH/NrfG
MMMNRDRLGFWTRFLAFGLAAVFILSGIFFGMGSGISYNPLDLFGGDDQAGGQTVDEQKQIEQQTREAEKELKENPDDTDNVTDLAGLYYQSNRVDDAAKVLEEGQQKAPDNADIPMFLGQVYAQQAQGAAKDKERDGLQEKSAEAFAAAAQNDPKNEEAFLFAGEAYSQVGESGQAIKYWNGYLDLEPEGEQSKEVRQRIEDTLQGGSTSAGS